MWFPTCLECCFSMLHIYETVNAAYLWNSGWIPICCYWSLPKSCGCCFQYVVTAHLISIGCVSINVVNAVSLNSGCGFSRCFHFQWIWCSRYCNCTFNKKWVDFHFISLLFYEALFVIFHMFLLFSFKKQWM